MDFIGIVIFILFIVLKALGESNKKSKRRGTRPVFTDRRPPVFFPKQEETPSPEVEMEWEMPPAFPFPWEETPQRGLHLEEVEPEEVFLEKPRGIEQGRAPLEEVVVKEKPKSPKKYVPVTTKEIRSEREPVTLSPKQVLGGIIWAEIIQSPRALRPYRPVPWRNKN